MKTKAHAAPMVTVATFNAVADAEALKNWLVGKRIPAEVRDETRLQKYWLLAEPTAGVHVETPRDSFPSVEILLHESKALPFVRTAVHCPSCGSVRVQYPDLTRKNILPTLFAQLFVLLGVTRHKFYCEDCHFSWSTAPSRSQQKPENL